MGLAVTAARGPDRRQQPRRHEDALLHYAEQNLLAAAVTLADKRREGSSIAEGFALLDQLDQAAATYRHALGAAQAAR